MRISLQVVVQNEGGVPGTVTEIAQFEREGFDAGSLGAASGGGEVSWGNCSAR